MEVSGQLHAPAVLHPVPIGYEAGWPPESVWTLWRKEKYFTAWNRTPDVQLVARRYTDKADSRETKSRIKGTHYSFECGRVLPKSKHEKVPSPCLL
jgi:hypothetical protein